MSLFDWVRVKGTMSEDLKMQTNNLINSNTLQANIQNLQQKFEYGSDLSTDYTSEENDEIGYTALPILKNEFKKDMILFDKNNIAAEICSFFSDIAFLYNGDMLKIENENMIHMQERVDAGESVIGAAMVDGVKVGVLASAQSISSVFLPILHRLKEVPIVFHFDGRVVHDAEYLVNCTNSVFQLAMTSVPVLVSSCLVENRDFAVLAHMLAFRMNAPMVHFMDNVDYSLNLKLPLKEKLDSYMMKHQNKLIQNDMHDVFDDVVNELHNDGVLHKKYKPYMVYGDIEHAKLVYVVFGQDSGVFANIIKMENTMNCAVVKVLMLKPWNNMAFVKMLPMNVEKVIVLTRLEENLTYSSGLLQSVQGAVVPLNSDVKVVHGLYAYRDYIHPLNMVEQVNRFAYKQDFNFLALPREWLDNVKTIKFANNYNVLTLEKENIQLLEHFYEFSKTFAFYGHGQHLYDQNTLNEILETLHGNDRTVLGNVAYHNVYPNFKLGPQQVLDMYSRILVTIGPQSHSHAVPDGTSLLDIVVCQDVSTLNRLPFINNLKPFGKILLMNTTWTDMDMVDNKVQNDVKQFLSGNHIQLYSTPLKEDCATLMLAFLQIGSNVFSTSLSIHALKSKYPTLENLSDRIKAWQPLESWSTVENMDTLQAKSIKFVALHDNIFKKSKLLLANDELTISCPNEIVAPHQIAWKLMFREAFDTKTPQLRNGAIAMVKLTKWVRFTPDDYSRNVFHVEMDTTGTGLTYEIGQALTVYGRNKQSSVLEFLNFIKQDPHVFVSYHGEVMTIYQLFAQVLDVFGRPTKKFYECILPYAKEAEAKKLNHILSAEGDKEYKHRVDHCVTFAELITEFHLTDIPISTLMNIIPTIKPRHYSISSSRNFCPNSVHLLVVLHDWQTPSGKTKFGQCSEFLAECKVGDYIPVSVCSSVMKLPASPLDPIIMAGLGTGMAPFRAFLQEKAYLRAKGIQVGPIALYFGSRHRAKEYLYGDELDQYEKDGLLTYLRCAFSRDEPGKKVYIQHRIEQDEELLYQLLHEQNGHFYMCGPTWPVSDVRNALEKAYLNNNHTKEQVSEIFESMKLSGRYVLEVY